jgi:hypothetical protein
MYVCIKMCIFYDLGTTVALSRFLQTATVNIKRATDAIKDTMDVLKSKRENADSVFGQLFSEAQDQAKQLDVELKSPRTISRQIHRPNHPSQSVEEYFRRSIYIPLLDSVLNDLSLRLSPDVLDLFQLGVFLPKPAYSDREIETVQKLVEMYQPFLDGSKSSIVNEYRLWMVKWKRAFENNSPIPESVVQVVETCDQDFYPNISIFLKILATLPVSVATAERSFSTLRRVKSWLRASMAQERLSGLALLNIHKTIDLNVDEIIDIFAKKKKNRIRNLINIFSNVMSKEFANFRH